jgi:hypothetical protein
MTGTGTASATARVSGQVEAAFRPVAVHAGEEYLPGAAVRHRAGPFYGIDSTGLASAVRVHLPARARGARVDRDHDRLRAEASRGLLDERRIVDLRRC